MNKLKNLKITAVALCKQGANPDAHIMLYKSIDPKGGSKMKTLEEILKSLPQEEQDVLNAELEKAKKANVPDGDMEDLMDGGVDENTETKGAKGNKQAKSLVKSLSEKIKTLEANHVAKSAEEAEAELMKSMPEAIRKSYELMKKNAEAAQAVAKALQEEKLTKEYVAKAAIYKHLPTKAEELGDILKSVAKIDSALCGKIEDILKATDALVEKGGIFKEFGDKGNQHTSNALETLEKCVAEMIAKSKDLTKEQAYAKALDLHPELYAAYVKSLSEEE